MIIDTNQRPKTYEEAKELSENLYDQLVKLTRIFISFPKGARGLTTPEYKKTKAYKRACEQFKILYTALQDNDQRIERLYHNDVVWERNRGHLLNNESSETI